MDLTQEEWGRFDSRLALDEQSACLLWTGELNNQGYGRMVIYRDGGARRRVLAHRLAFIRAHGFVPTVTRHACDTPRCCNPEQLLAGTQAENIRDAVDRARINTSGLDAWRAHMVAAAAERIALGIKTCVTCRVTKSLDDFHLNKTANDGRQGRCKACRVLLERAGSRQS